MVELERLRAVPLFADLSAAALRQLAASVAEEHIAAHEILFRQGEIGYSCYVVLNGELEVVTYLGGEELRLSVRHPGHLIGEMALLDRGPRSATIRALTDSILIRLEERDFFTLMHGNPEIALETLRDAATRQRQTSRQLIAGLEQKNTELKQAYDDLKTAQHELIRLNRIEEELAVARRIQERFLPRHVPQPPGWQIAAYNRGALEVGGDFFDCIELPGDLLGLVVADVSGKGVPAALFVALTRSLVRAASQAPWAFRDERQLSPEDVLIGALWLANDYIAREHSESSMFITLFYALLDPHTGRMSYVNAGHNPPVIVAADGAIRELAESATLPLGIVAGQSYTAAHDQINQGELLVAFSDGITEAMNAAGEVYGDAALLDAIRNGAALSAEALLDALIASVRAHAAGTPQADDMTLMIVRRP